MGLAMVRFHVFKKKKKKKKSLQFNLFLVVTLLTDCFIEIFFQIILNIKEFS